MPLKCLKYQSEVIKKNRTIHNGKQKYECLSCHRQFVENRENKVVSHDTKERIRRALLERVSLKGLCRIFDVSLPWLLQFMEKIYEELPDDLNATVYFIIKNLRSSQRKFMRCGVMLETSKISSGFGW